MDENQLRAERLFEDVLRYAESAALLDNAAGYNVAINALKYAAAVLHPEKFGTKVTNSSGGTEGYILETGIRREGDPGFVPSGALHNEQATEPRSGIPGQDGHLEGQDLTDDVGFHQGPD